MAFRYRLVGLAPTDIQDPAKLLNRISPNSFPGQQWHEIVQHMHRIGARSLLIQEGVRDPDFLEEYEAFYSKQHRPMSRFCIRVHVFKNELADEAANDVNGVLTFIDAAAVEPSSYVGFVTVRPLRHAPVGATILVDSPASPALCKDEFPVHIAGTTFKVSGTPYLQQDNAVGACAQASMWMALRTLRRRSGNSAYSPAELTLSATQYIAQNRVFPGREGLTVEQMLLAIRASKHDPLVIQIARLGEPGNPYRAIEEAQPYIESGLPVVTILFHPNSGGHAVVAIGLSSGPALLGGFPPGLIIHNDNRGPYLELPPTVPDDSDHYALAQAMSLIVPLPEDVVMSAAEAKVQAVKHLVFWLSAFLVTPLAADEELPGRDLALRTYLCTRHSFRKWAKESPQLDAKAKDIYRTSEMPRFVWVVEIHDATLYEPGKPSKCSRLGEVVLDAAADALHGDSLVFVRIAKQMVIPPSSSEALLAIAGERAVVALATSSLSEGIAEPWAHG
jgi:hypothetical protein